MQKSLNDISADELEEIKKWAALFYTPKEIAVIQEIDIDAFTDACQQEGSAIFNAFFGGRLMSESELRTSIIKLAKSGSSPAQTMALDMLNKSKMKMLDR